MRIGLEVLVGTPDLASEWGRCGLLCNQASVNQSFAHASTILQEVLGPRLTCLFGPQHGLYGTVQDNMIETEHSTDRHLGLKVFSLYSETRQPTKEMMDEIDTLIVDLQNVGCRVYTFKASLLAVMQSAREYGKRVVVLDRPNPLGGVFVEGRIADRGAESFVAPGNIPMRHGLTMGEMATFFNKTIGADLDVVAMAGWNAEAVWNDQGRQWAMTSPNLPTIDPVHVFPGMVLFEGTNVSEGRGTALPFQLIGAPYIVDEWEFVSTIKGLVGTEQGVVLRPTRFQPTYQKWAGKECRGVHISVTSPKEVRSYRLALAIIEACRRLGEGAFAWSEPPYEYDYETTPIKMIVGSKNAVRELENLDLESGFWNEGTSEFIELAKSCLLYPREQKVIF